MSSDDADDALQQIEELLPLWQKGLAACERVDQALADPDSTPLLELSVRGPGGSPAKAVVDLSKIEDDAVREAWMAMLQQYFYREWRDATRHIARAFSKLERELRQQEQHEAPSGESSR